MADTAPETATAPVEDVAALQAQLDDLVAQATAKYAVKEYREAAELYSRSTELKAQINGEMSTENADLLYLYGRCLYHVAVINSDVLGSKVAGEKPEQTKSTSKSSKGTNGAAKASSSKAAKPEDTKTEEVLAAVVEEQEKGTEEESSESKPFFVFAGDGDYGESDDDDEEAEGEAEEGAEEEEDDFSNAFEVLDLARVLLQRKLEALEEAAGKEKFSESSDITRLKERLADTYDLQAEISLENEQFPNAAADLKSALELKRILFPQESSLLAEAHYKLSLALEFSSVTQQKDADGNVQEGEAQVDEAMREEAAVEMEAAIASCEARIKKEEASLKADDPKAKITKEGIEDVKDMVSDMKQRLVELRQPPVSINDPTGTGSIDGATPLQGILGSILGESPEAQKARLDEASKEAKDLTSLVKRKKTTLSAENGASSSIAGSKRKTEEPEPQPEASKKAKVEDADE